MEATGGHRVLFHLSLRVFRRADAGAGAICSEYHSAPGLCRAGRPGPGGPDRRGPRPAAWRKFSPPRPIATPTPRCWPPIDYLALVWALLASLAIYGEKPSLRGADAAPGPSPSRALLALAKSASTNAKNPLFQTKSFRISERGRNMGVEGRDKQKALEGGAVALAGQARQNRAAAAQGLQSVAVGIVRTFGRRQIDHQPDRAQRDQSDPGDLWRLAQALDVGIENVLRADEIPRSSRRFRAATRQCWSPTMASAG